MAIAILSDVHGNLEALTAIFNYLEKIAVIGSGTMGNGIAHVFAQNSYKVQLIDISKEILNKAMSVIEKKFQRLRFL